MMGMVLESMPMVRIRLVALIPSITGMRRSRVPQKLISRFAILEGIQGGLPIFNLHQKALHLQKRLCTSGLTGYPPYNQQRCWKSWCSVSAVGPLLVQLSNGRVRCKIEPDPFPGRFDSEACLPSSEFRRWLEIASSSPTSPFDRKCFSRLLKVLKMLSIASEGHQRFSCPYGK